MIAAMVRRNLRHQRFLLGSLVGGALAIEILLVNIAAAFQEGPGLEELFEALPTGFRRFFEGQIGELSFASFVAFGFQHPAILTMGLALLVLNATLPAAERESGLLELVLARPVSRARYLAANLVTVVLCAVLFPLVQLAGAAIGLALVHVDAEPHWTRYVYSAVGQACLLLVIGSLSLLFAAGAPRRGVAVAQSLGVILLTYVPVAFEGLYQPLRMVSWASPFHYFQPIRSALGEASPVDFIVLPGLALVAIALAFRRFLARDL